MIYLLRNPGHLICSFPSGLCSLHTHIQFKVSLCPSIPCTYAAGAQLIWFTSAPNLDQLFLQETLVSFSVSDILR